MVLSPLAFLFFMVPLPAIVLYAITFPLQLLAVRQAAWALDLLRSVVLRNRTDGALERVTIPVYGSAAETTERLVKYVQAMYPRLGEHLLG